MASKGKKSKSTFREAAAKCPLLAPHHEAGIQALEAPHKHKILNGQISTGSINYDEALRPSAALEHRVDYGVGLPLDKTTEKVLWLEVHHAASGETDRVVKKFEALKAWLPEHAPALWKLPRVFVWQLTNTESNPNDRLKRNKLAAKHGIRRIPGMLDLSKL
jgi:hypothetical protein